MFSRLTFQSIYFICKSVFQHQALAEEGFEVREQVRQAPEEGGRVQLPEPVEDGQEERVHHGRRPGKRGAQETRLGPGRERGKVQVSLRAASRSRRGEDIVNTSSISPEFVPYKTCSGYTITA